MNTKRTALDSHPMFAAFEQIEDMAGKGRVALDMIAGTVAFFASRGEPPLSDDLILSMYGAIGQVAADLDKIRSLAAEREKEGSASGEDTKTGMDERSAESAAAGVFAPLSPETIQRLDALLEKWSRRASCQQESNENDGKQPMPTQSIDELRSRID
jgi:hypothetical protein